MAFTIRETKEVVNRLSQAMQENKDNLVELDAKMGDGDLGLTMSKGFKAAAEFINDFEGTDIGNVLLKLAMEMNNAASSTMGTLISSGFMRAGKEVKGKEELDTEDIMKIAEAGVEGIQDRGKAKQGDKTILDSLIPGVEALTDALEDGKSLSEAFDAACKAAEEGVEATKDMVSQHGRAHYYGEKSKGHKDPGSVVALIGFRAVRDYLKED